MEEKILQELKKISLHMDNISLFLEEMQKMQAVEFFEKRMVQGKVDFEQIHEILFEMSQNMIPPGVVEHYAKLSKKE